MWYIPRNLGNVVRQAARHFPALVVTGPRRARKTTLLRQLFPKAQYVLLEDPDIQGRTRNDPRTFLEELRPPVVFDEIQNAPELLSYVRTLIDAVPRQMGRWLFTGSREAPPMQGITESMAGRAAILQLLPFSVAETPKVNVLHGGFPEALARPKSRALWFASYLQTYLERDVRAITNIRDLVTYVRNRSDVALQVSLEVGSEPQCSGLGTCQCLWEAAVKHIHLWSFCYAERQKLQDGSPAGHRFGNALHRWRLPRAGE